MPSSGTSGRGGRPPYWTRGTIVKGILGGSAITSAALLSSMYISDWGLFSKDEKETSAPEKPGLEEKIEEPAKPVVAEPKIDGPDTEPNPAEPVVAVEVTPIVVEPVIIEPVVAEPKVAEPVIAEPVVVEPKVAEPVIAEPVVVEPKVVEPKVAEPVVVEPKPADVAGAYSAELVGFAKLPGVEHILTQYRDALKQIKDNKRMDANLDIALANILGNATLFRKSMDAYSRNEHDKKQMDSIITDIQYLRTFYGVTRRGFYGGWDVLITSTNETKHTRGRPVGVLDSDHPWRTKAERDAEVYAKSKGAPWDGMTSTDFVEAYVTALADQDDTKDADAKREQGRKALEEMVQKGFVAVPNEVAAVLMVNYGTDSVRRYGLEIQKGDSNVTFNPIEKQVVMIGRLESQYRVVVPDEATMGGIARSLEHYDGLLKEAKPAAEPAAKPAGTGAGNVSTDL